MRPGIHLAHNSAKLKIFNLPKHIQLLRFGNEPAVHFGETCRFRRCDLFGPFPSDPLVGGLLPTDQGSDGGLDTKTTTRSCRAAVFTALALELVGAFRPDIQFALDAH
jgi:hypothetical protein